MLSNASYKVYTHTTPSGKIYVGITSLSMQRRRSSGYTNNPHFSRAIKKYGWENIRTDVVYDNLSKSEACQLEILQIEQLHSNDERYGYNISSGGESHNGCHFNHSEETKQKISEHNSRHWLGKKRPPLSEKHKQQLITSKCLKVECVETGMIYNSVTDAMKDTGASHISKCCKGKAKTSGGYHWRYVLS